MCECGCGEFQPFARFPGPKGVTYTISTYTSVDCGCSNPAGVIITRITAEVLKSWGMGRSDIDRLPELQFSERLHDYAVAVIGKDEMRKEAESLFDDSDEIGPDAAEIGDCLQGALRRTTRNYPPMPEAPHA